MEYDLTYMHVRLAGQKLQVEGTNTKPKRRGWGWDAQSTAVHTWGSELHHKNSGVKQSWEESDSLIAGAH